MQNFTHFELVLGPEMGYKEYQGNIKKWLLVDSLTSFLERGGYVCKSQSDPLSDRADSDCTMHIDHLCKHY